MTRLTEMAQWIGAGDRTADFGRECDERATNHEQGDGDNPE